MQWLLLAGGILVLVGALWWLSPSRKIGVNPNSVTVPQDATTTLTVQLLYHSWFKRTLKPIHGSITVTVPQSLGTAAPITVNTQPAGTRSGTTTITGIARGTGRIVLTGTSRKGTHDRLTIPFTVT